MDVRKFFYLWFFLIFSSGIALADVVYEDLDGIYIQAIDEYPSLKKNEFTMGLDYFPFEPYHHGVGVSAGYTRYLNKRWGWEIINGNFVFMIDKGLINELAEDFGEEPVTIEQTEFVASTNLKYVLNYGKNIFFDKYIRLTRSELVFGLGTIGTNLNNYVALTLGIQFDFVISESFSWKIEFMDYITFQRDRGTFLDYGAFKALLAWRY
ncbi:MAG: hypothetical protein H6620_04200 [Halobacteriovoraceae bacterium]|nr:hypothetical protein [Halobacteriovoraceae bacterium]